MKKQITDESKRKSYEGCHVENGRVTDRYFHWYEALDDRPDLIAQIEAASENDRSALIIKLVDEYMGKRGK